MGIGTRPSAEVTWQHGLAHDHVGVDDEDELLLRLHLLQPVQHSHRLVDAAASREACRQISPPWHGLTQ